MLRQWPLTWQSPCSSWRSPMPGGACGRAGGGEIEAHHPEQGIQEPFGLAQREMVDKPQGQGGFDGEIRVPPLPTPPAAPAGRPGSDRFRGQPHRHIAAANEGLVIGRPVRNAVLRLLRGMDLRLHSCMCGSYQRAREVRPPQGLHATTPRVPPSLFGLFVLDLYTDVAARADADVPQWVSKVADPVAYVESAWPTPTRWNGSSAPS